MQARLLNPGETKSNRQRADEHYGQSDNERSARSRRKVKHSPPPSSPPQSRRPSPYALVATKSRNRDCPQLFCLGLLPLPSRYRRRLARASKFLARNGKTLPDDACNLAAGRANSSCLQEPRQCRRPDRAFLATHVRLCCGSQARWILHGQALRRQRHLDN